METDWKAMFLPEHWAEVFLRGSIMYLALFALLRFVTRRRLGSLGPSDILVLVLLSDAAQNGMTGQYESVPDGIVSCATIIFWATLLDWLGYKSEWFRKILEPEPLELVHSGRFVHGNMKREMLGEKEVLSLLRENGVKDLREVEKAYLEPDGKFSVLRADGKIVQKQPESSAGA
jgi:uncharacterized membrane protein YcaP (DUF421 family)